MKSVRCLIGIHDMALADCKRYNYCKRDNCFHGDKKGIKKETRHSGTGGD